MSETFAERPSYFEGQYLAAQDLAALVDYTRVHASRHALGLHTWGIATGLELIEVSGTTGAVDVYLLPGYALDGYGRAVVVLEPCKLPADLFVKFASDGIPVWLRFDEQPWRSLRPGFKACCAMDAFSRVGETYVIEAGWHDAVADREGGLVIAGEDVADAREARRLFEAEGPLQCDASVPFQALPPAEEAGRWLIPLGLVGWQAGPPGRFVALSDAQKTLARRLRRQAGVVAEGLYAANGIIRLRDRFTPFDAAKTVEELCEADRIDATDLRFCAAHAGQPGHLEFAELIWLEGRVRLTGDARLFGTRLEFRDADGSPYIKENGQPGSTPLFLQRREENERGGQDLQVLIGKSGNGRNRLVIGQVTASQAADPCSVDYAVVDRVVVQDNGRVGLGTLDPTSVLAVPLTVRGTGAAGDLIGFEDPEGERRWQTDLGPELENLNFVETGPGASRLFLEKGGDVGIGTTAPEAKLDVAQVRATEGGAALGSEVWLRVGNGGDTGRVWVENGSQGAPRLVLSGSERPPRIQFQQVGDGEEDAPGLESWIGHAKDESPDLAVMGGRLGVGTMSPYTSLTVEGSIGFMNSAEPAIFLFKSGSQNAEKMVVAHSPARDQWGLSFRDVGNLMIFKGAGAPILAVDLQDERVGVNTTNPTQKLDVRGEIKLGANGAFFALGGVEKLRVVAGQVSEVGVRIAGEGFEAAPTGEGQYLIAFTHPFISAPTIVASAINASNADNLASIHDVTASTFRVFTKDVTPDGEGNLQNTAFSFVAFGLRD